MTLNIGYVDHVVGAVRVYRIYKIAVKLNIF